MNLTNILRFRSPTSDVLPRSSGSDNSKIVDEWQKLRRGRVEISLDEATEIGLAGKLSDVPCSKNLPPRAFAIADVINVRGSRFRLIKDNGALLSAVESQQLIDKLGLKQEAEANGH